MGNVRPLCQDRLVRFLKAMRWFRFSLSVNVLHASKSDNEMDEPLVRFRLSLRADVQRLVSCLKVEVERLSPWLAMANGNPILLRNEDPFVTVTVSRHTVAGKSRPCPPSIPGHVPKVPD